MMMGGSASSGTGEFGTIAEFLALLDDANKTRYEQKLKALDERVKSAQSTLEKAATERQNAKSTMDMANRILAQADAKNTEAKTVLAETERRALQLAQDRAALDSRETEHKANVAAYNASKQADTTELGRQRQQLADRDRAVTDRAQDTEACRTAILEKAEQDAAACLAAIRQEEEASRNHCADLEAVAEADRAEAARLRAEAEAYLASVNEKRRKLDELLK